MISFRWPHRQPFECRGRDIQPLWAEYGALSGEAPQESAVVVGGQYSCRSLNKFAPRVHGSPFPFVILKSLAGAVPFMAQGAGMPGA